MSIENKEEVMIEVRTATEQGGDLAEQVRAIVTNALVARRVDVDSLRAVMSATVDGVGAGLAARGGEATDALRDAVRGLDQAVTRSVHALQLAMDEARGEGRHFSETELRETVDAVRSSEEELMRTLREASEKSQGWLKTSLTDLVDHMRRAGTDTGGQARAVLETLNNRLGATASGSGRDAAEAVSLSGRRLSEVASGILRGLADAIDARKQ